MGNCKDCKFWEFRVDMYNKSWNTCEAVAWVDYDSRIGDDSFAIYASASDDSGLEAGLKTGPMFGCNKFQERCAGLGLASSNFVLIHQEESEDVEQMG